MNKAVQLAPLFLVSFAALFVFWIIFVGTLAKQEMLVGLFSALLGAIALCVVQHAQAAHFRPRLRHWLEFLRMPWYILSGTWELFTVTLKDVFGIKPAESQFRLATFRTGEECDEEDTGRRVLAVAYTTVSPNFIVLGMDIRDRWMLFHQVERSEVLQMDKNLGAEG